MKSAIALCVICVLCLKEIILVCQRPLVISYRCRLNRDSEDIRVYGQRHSVFVQCGKCDDCVKRYQNDWMVRNYFQLRESRFATFVTFTYRDECIPLGVEGDTSVCKDDIQRFLKRFREFRRKRGLSTDFKYFVTSEYGPTTLRSHYHALLFSIRLNEFLEFASVWHKEFGFTKQRELVFADTANAMRTCRYTSKYCAKGDFENPLVELGLVEKNFHLISKGIGKSYINDRTKSYHLALDFYPKRNSDGEYSHAYLEEIYRRSRVFVGSFAYHLPRFYREAFFSKRKDLQIAYSDFICQKFLDEYEGKLAVIQTDKTPRGRFQASIVLYNQTLAEEYERAVETRKNIVNHLKKSKI